MSSEIRALNKQTTGVYMHLDSTENIQQIINQKISQQLRKPVADVAIINGTQAVKVFGIPYLTINDALLFGPKKSTSPDEGTIHKLAAELRLAPTIFQKKFSEVTMIEAIKVQLLHSLIKEKKIIILNDIFSLLTTKEIQTILSLLHQIAHKEEIEIFCYTANQQIAESNYVDQLF